MRSEVNGVGIEFEVAGEGRPVVLIHGFPDTGRLWRHQVPVLVDAGFQVIVPTMRGYGASDKPGEIADYNIALLAGDVIGVLDQLGIERAHLVGHDWGALVAWVLAMMAAPRVDHLAVLSVGNPATFGQAGLEQREKSWYMLLFQWEGIAEQWLSSNDWTNFREWMGHPDADAVIRELDADGSLTPALHWYRANLSPASFVAPPLELPPIPAPTMGVWSSGDRHLTEVQMTLSARAVSGPWRYERIEGAGHHMQLDAPQAVNALLLDFLPR